MGAKMTVRACKQAREMAQSPWSRLIWSSIEALPAMWYGKETAGRKACTAVPTGRNTKRATYAARREKSAGAAPRLTDLRT